MPDEVSRKLNDLETEIRILREKLVDSGKLVEVRIGEFDKRNETLLATIKDRNEAVLSSVKEGKDFVDARARHFGLVSVFGLPIALAVLIYVIYSTAGPIVKDAAREVAKTVDWNKKVQEVADEEVAKLVTPEVLARSIDKKSIEAAASDAVATPAFHAALKRVIDDSADLFKPDKNELKRLATATAQRFQPEIEKAVSQSVERDLKNFVSEELIKRLVEQYATDSLLKDPQFSQNLRKAVVSVIDEQLADSTAFRAMVDEKLQAERDRILALTKASKKVDGSSRNDLEVSLAKAVTTIADPTAARHRFTEITFYPLDDTVCVVVTLIWEPAESKPLGLFRLKLSGANAANVELRQRLDKYFNQPTFDEFDLKDSGNERGPKFVAETFFRKADKFATMKEFAEFAARQVLDVCEDCIGVTYPAHVRVLCHGH